MKCSLCGFRLPRKFSSDVCDVCYDTELLFEADNTFLYHLLLPTMARLNSQMLARKR